MTKSMFTGVAVAGLLALSSANAQRALHDLPFEQAVMAQTKGFAEMDADHNGVVSKEEMRVKLATLASEDPPQRVLDIGFATIDTDGDGKATAREAAAAHEARFTEADTDHNGVLSAEEQRTLMQGFAFE